MKMLGENSVSEKVTGNASEININIRSLEELTVIFSQIFKTKTFRKSLLNIRIDSELLVGTVQIANLQKEISFLTFNCTAKKQFKFSLKKFPFNQIHFFFNCRGNMKVKTNQSTVEIPQLRLAALKSNSAEDLQIIFKAGKSYQSTILNFLGDENGWCHPYGMRTYTELFAQLSVNPKLSKQLSNYNLKLVDLHKKIEEISHHSDMGKLHLKAKHRELLVAYVSQLEDDMKKPFKSPLNQRQTEAAWEASRIIKENFTANFTVPEIARQVFMCSSQLQYCFRTIFNKALTNIF